MSLSPVRVHLIAANGIVPKLVAMATSLRHSISAMSSLDSLSPKESNSESLAAIQSKLCQFKVYLPHPHTKGTTDPRGGWGTPIMFGMDVLTSPQIGPIALDFPIFLALENGRAQSVDFWPGNRQNCFFRPSNF